MKLGAVVYGLAAIGWIVSAGAVYLGYGSYAAADRWYQLAISALLLLTGVLFGIGAVTRRGLASDDGPRICRQGWILVIALVGAGLVVWFLGDSDWGAPFSTASAVFIPHWIRRLREKYQEGRVEAEVEAVRRRNAAGVKGEPGEGPRGGS
ncbi:hypothetical protein [Kribbella sp. NPDC004536]|uniref:hypothetical protein n=1 Tax=Kribbella sp. NPDC004536 TaxID=3364106 RepID=UPI00368AEB66